MKSRLVTQRTKSATHSTCTFYSIFFRLFPFTPSLWRASQAKVTPAWGSAWRDGHMRSIMRGSRLIRNQQRSKREFAVGLGPPPSQPFQCSTFSSVSQVLFLSCFCLFIPSFLSFSCISPFTHSHTAHSIHISVSHHPRFVILCEHIVLFFGTFLIPSLAPHSKPWRTTKLGMPFPHRQRLLPMPSQTCSATTMTTTR